MASQTRQRRRTWITRLAILAASVGVIVVGMAVASPSAPVASVRVGDRAPAFQLAGARGGTHESRALLGQPLLLAFLNPQARAGETPPDQSRSQVVFLRSMLQQYGDRGLRVVIVDAARLTTGRATPANELLNYTYDWQLDTIPVLIDADGQTARRYGVRAAPTTFLITGAGQIAQRWDGFAAAPQLALALQAALGQPGSTSVRP